MKKAASRRRRRIRIKMAEGVTAALKELQISLRSPRVAAALHAGAEMIAQAARPDAPVDTGQLQKGILVASILRNEYRPLVRLRGGIPLNSPLKSPPRTNQVLAWSSVYYTRWIERGRKARTHDATRARKRERRGVGQLPKRPFFQRAKRKMRKAALAEVEQRLVQVIEEAWARKGSEGV